MIENWRFAVIFGEAQNVALELIYSAANLNEIKKICFFKKRFVNSIIAIRDKSKGTVGKYHRIRI